MGPLTVQAGRDRTRTFLPGCAGAAAGPPSGLAGSRPMLMMRMTSEPRETIVGGPSAASGSAGRPGCPARPSGGPPAASMMGTSTSSSAKSRPWRSRLC
eukprot:196516-Chlamydomonas_euryale.AAC.2